MPEQELLFDFKPKTSNLEFADLAKLRQNNSPSAVRIFQRRVALALLHRDSGKYCLIDQAIAQAKDHGISYVLCKISPEAKKFYSLAAAVAREKHRAISFLRLQPVTLTLGEEKQQQVLYGEFELEHQTAELVMLHFMKRFPRYGIMIIFGKEAYLGYRGEIRQEQIERSAIILPAVKDDFERYWLAFYRSQYIPERKNLRYLKRMLPKKYWGWVTELKEFGLEV
jgi:probable DNA metabolism protein